MDFPFDLPGIAQLTPEELQAVTELLDIEKFSKGTVLLREGEIADKCYFIFEGCIRQFILHDGIDKTTAFYTEQQAVVSFTSYTQHTPVDHWLECAEDCLLLTGTQESEEKMYAQFPKLAEITRSMMAQDFGKVQEEMAAFMTSTPEERYLQLQNNRNDLLQRVPQHQIASYIGITPESLSRLRKRILSK